MQYVAGVEVPDQSRGVVGALTRGGGCQVGQAFVRCGGVQGQDAPGAGPERLGDGTPFEVRVSRDVERGEEQHTAFDRDRAQDLTAHHRSGESGRGESGDAAAAGESLGVRGTQGAVDGRGERVVVETQRHTDPRLHRPCVQGCFKVGGVAAGEGEQGVRAVDLGGFEDALVGDVTDDGGYAQTAGEGDAACFGVLFHADHGDAEFAQPGEDPRADFA